MSIKKKKGNFLEDVVSKLHRFPGVKVSQNVQIPELGEHAYKREFDIILELPEQEIKFFIECKNYDSVIGIEHIDQFVGKLNAIGSDVKNGIFVSAKGFKRTVAERAKERGLSVWEVDGLDKTGFGLIAGSAYINQLILLPVIESISSFDYGAKELLAIRNKDGAVINYVPNIIYEQWKNGEINRSIGNQTIEIKQDLDDDSGLPKGLLGTYIVDLNIVGVLITKTGDLYKFDLVEPITKEAARTHFEGKFLHDKNSVVTSFLSEIELKEFASKQTGISVDQPTIFSPRIQFIHAYYPFSNRAIRKMEELQATNKEFSFKEIEGFDLTRLWDEV